MFLRALHAVLSKFKKKQKKSDGFVAVDYSRGLFSAQQPAEIETYIKQFYSEEMDMTLNINYVCCCGTQVYFTKSDDYFGCLHCDSVCNVRNCEFCEVLNSIDLGEDK